MSYFDLLCDSWNVLVGKMCGETFYGLVEVKTNKQTWKGRAGSVYRHKSTDMT